MKYKVDKLKSKVLILTSGAYSQGTPFQPYPKKKLYKKMKATAVHCVASLLLPSGRPIMAMNIARHVTNPAEHVIMIVLRPNRSIVGGRNMVEIANTVLTTPARS